MIILSVCSIVAGFVPFANFVTPDGVPVQTHMNLLFSALPVTLVLISILIAAWLYKKQNEKPAKIAATFGGLYQATYKKFYIDEIYLFITQKIIFNLIGRPAAWIDKNVVDGMVNGIGNITAFTSYKIKSIQSGKVQSYALYFFGGVAGLAVLFIYLWK